LEGPRTFGKDEVIDALRFAAPRLWLVSFDGTSGLVRTTNLEKDAAIRALNGVEAIAGERVRIRTIGTSGTIRAATEKYLKGHDRTRSRARKEPL